MWYNGDMVINLNVLTNEWTIAGVIISGFVAVGTISLAIMTWKSNRTLRMQYRNRQLDEVIAWANEVKEWDIDTSYEAKKELKEADNPLLVILMQLSRLSDGFDGLKKRGQLIIRPLVLTYKVKSLINSLDKVLEDLQEHMELLGLQEIAIMKTITSKSQTLSNEFNLAEGQVVEHKKILNNNALKVIEETSQIKTKD